MTPGYGDEVIFADGTFIDGSTAELSADGPIRPPFVVYCQVWTARDLALSCYAVCAIQAWQLSVQMGPSGLPLWFTAKCGELLRILICLDWLDYTKSALYKHGCLCRRQRSTLQRRSVSDRHLTALQGEVQNHQARAATACHTFTVRHYLSCTGRDALDALGHCPGVTGGDVEGGGKQVICC